MTAAAIAHGTVPFPVGEVHSSDFTALDAILGEEFQGTKGKVYRLVTATAAVASPATKIFMRTAAGGTAVELTVSDTASYCCGVAVTDQVALAIGDYFFLQVDGEMSVTATAAHGISSGVYLQPSGPAAAAGLVKSATSAMEPQLPLRAHTVATNAITAYPVQKLWGN